MITYVTSYDHTVSPAEDSIRVRGILGDFVCFADIGKGMAAEIIDNNTVRIYEGLLLAQGRQVQIEAGTYEDFTVESGTAGVNRTDIVGLVLEDGTLTKKVWKDTSSVDSGDFWTGSTEINVPLYKLTIEGIDLAGITRLFDYYHTDENHKAIFQQSSTPETPKKGDFWLSGNAIKYYTGSAWSNLYPQTTTANVLHNSTSISEKFGNCKRIYVQSSTPSKKDTGDFWLNGNVLKCYSGSAWNTVSLQTESEQVLKDGTSINDILDTLSTFTSGISSTSFNCPDHDDISYTSKGIKLQRIGPLVLCEVMIYASVKSANTEYKNIFTIPDGYKPNYGSAYKSFSTPSISSNKMDGYETLYRVYGSGQVNMITGHTGLTERVCTMVWMTNDSWS